MNYISINNIMDRVTRHPLLKDLPFETVIDYTVEFIRVVGTPNSFLNKTEVIPIVQYRGELPCDFYEMIQVRISPNGPTFRYTTDSFHLSPHKPINPDLTYKVQGNVIFTSIKEGDIEVSYRALATDEDGYPLIPDNGTFVRALESYIKKQWFTIQFELGRITPQVMQKVDQEYAWQVGQAQVDMIRPTLDQMESITRMYNKFLPQMTRDHRNGFLHEGTEERMKIH